MSILENKKSNLTKISETPHKKSFKSHSLLEKFILEVECFSAVKGMTDKEKTAFLNYWSETGASGRMKFQLQETWETGGRIDKWIDAARMKMIAIPKPKAENCYYDQTPEECREGFNDAVSVIEMLWTPYSPEWMPEAIVEAVKYSDIWECCNGIILALCAEIKKSNSSKKTCLQGP